MSDFPRDHILSVPKWTFPIRVVQGVLAILILGLSAFGVSYFAWDGDSLAIFTSLATIITIVYHLGSNLKLPQFYNYWAHLALDIFLVVFWLCSFAVTASDAAAFTFLGDLCVDDPYCYKKRSLISARSLTKRSVSLYTYRNTLAAAAAFGAIEFVLFIITLATTSIALHRHRKAGGHCTPNSMNTMTMEPKGVELSQSQYPPQQQTAVYASQSEQQQIN